MFFFYQMIVLVHILTRVGIKVGVYCPVGKSDEGKFSLEVAVKSLDIFTR